MKKIFKFILFLIIFFSLSLNIVLLYNLKNGSNNCDNKINTDKIYTKFELQELFKKYQIQFGLVDTENIAIWNVDKITYKGFFKSDARKLFFIEEEYSCLEGVNCVNASSVKVDDEYNNKAIFVVAINDNNKDDVKFYILDESIMKDSDFVKEKEYDLK